MSSVTNSVTTMRPIAGSFRLIDNQTVGRP
jgi:hypothetical protein